MLDLLQESIKGYNLPFTILLGITTLYWIIAMLGVVDIDIGGDLDIDIDTNSDPEAESGGKASGGVLNTVFRIAGLTDAPIILILSIFSLMLWVLNLIANISFNVEDSAKTASLLLIPVVIGAFVSTRLLIRPLRPVMKLLKASEPPAQIIGESGVVISSTLDQKFGRIEVAFQGKPLLLNARLTEDKPALKKGDSILVVSKLEESETFIVRSL